MAHRGETANPDVQDGVCDCGNQSNHNRLFMSLAASAYVEEASDEYNPLEKEYDGEV